jgi:hypothetical protein
MCTKFDILNAFLKYLNDDCFNNRQKKAILLHCNTSQRLAIIEIIVNLFFHNVPVTEAAIDSLDKYATILRKIATQGSLITNETLAIHHKAVGAAIMVGTEHLKFPIMKKQRGKVGRKTLIRSSPPETFDDKDIVMDDQPSKNTSE